MALRVWKGSGSLFVSGSYGFRDYSCKSNQRSSGKSRERTANGGCVRVLSCILVSVFQGMKEVTMGEVLQRGPCSVPCKVARWGYGRGLCFKGMGEVGFLG